MMILPLLPCTASHLRLENYPQKTSGTPKQAFLIEGVIEKGKGLNKWISYRSLVYYQKGTASSALFPMTMGCVALSNAVMYDRLTFEREGKINSSQRLNQGTRIALFLWYPGLGGWEKKLSRGLTAFGLDPKWHDTKCSLIRHPLSTLRERSVDILSLFGVLSKRHSKLCSFSYDDGMRCPL